MKNSKTLMIVVITLIAVNCLLIGTLWYNTYHRKAPMPTGNAFEYLSKTLQLTPAQVKQYKALRDWHFNFTSKINNEMRMERDSFFDNLSNPSINSAQVSQLEGRILAHQQMLDTATFYHFRKLRAILTPNQQEKFNGVIQDVLHMMAGPNGPGRHSPGRPGAGPAARIQDGPTRGGLPARGQFNGKERRPPGIGKPEGGPPPPPYGRPGGPPPQGFGPNGPLPDGPPPGPPQ